VDNLWISAQVAPGAGRSCQAPRTINRGNLRFCWSFEFPGSCGAASNSQTPSRIITVLRGFFAREAGVTGARAGLPTRRIGGNPPK